MDDETTELLELESNQEHAQVRQRDYQLEAPREENDSGINNSTVCSLDPTPFLSHMSSPWSYRLNSFDILGTYCRMRLDTIQIRMCFRLPTSP
jgi:hypothetical protein